MCKRLLTVSSFPHDFYIVQTVPHRAINQMFVNFEMFANEMYWPDFVNYNQNKGIQKQCLRLSTQE